MDSEQEHAIKKLARKRGLLETIQVAQNKSTVNINPYSIQPCQYLLVIDFESTCWEQRNQRLQPEIIEFPAVLYNIKTGEIEEEFQEYVMPIESPKLSKFCVHLTGIIQDQVDQGVPLGTALMLFLKWLERISNKYNICFPNHISTSSRKKCALLTWSDWDLGICLNNECRRKLINKPNIFCQWIDLRALYREFYKRRPKGLRGALAEVGLDFTGVEHCGLHDARNTAFLAGAMIRDGVILDVTTNLLSDN